MELLNLLLPPPSARISGTFQGAWLSFWEGSRAQSLVHAGHAPCRLNYALSPRICISNRILVAILTGVLAAVWEPVCLELSSLGNSLAELFSEPLQCGLWAVLPSRIPMCQLEQRIVIA